MARKKIAPTLRRLAMFDGAAWTEADERNAAAEFRALLSVARAARTVLEIVQTCSCGCGEPIGSDKGNGGDGCPMDGEPELERALDRLDRLSEPREGR